MAVSRLIRRPIGLVHDHEPSSSFSSSKHQPKYFVCRCVSKGGFNVDHEKSSKQGKDEGKPGTAKAACGSAASMYLNVMSSQRNLYKGFDFVTQLEDLKDDVFENFHELTKKRQFEVLDVQMAIEKVILDCRFFTLLAVAGSLLGSVLCFVEGCFKIMESYFHYFQALTQKMDLGHLVPLLIEAIDMYLIGTAMLVLGMGLHVMFMGRREGSAGLLRSNMFGQFYLKTLPSWAGIQSITQAKSKIGQAVVMILQVGVLEKFKSVPLLTGFDLACFAGAVLISSASIFLLSKLAGGGDMAKVP